MGQFDWSDPIYIAQGANPDIAIDKNLKRIHIVTTGVVATSGVWHTVLDSLGTIISQEVVPGTEGDSGGWQAGASIAVDNDGFAHICYRNKYRNSLHWDVYYKRQDATGWLGSIRIGTFLARGYNVRLAIDGQNRVHIGMSSVPDPNYPYGKVTVFRVIDGQVSKRLDEAIPYRADDRFEIDATENGIVHLVLGYPEPSEAPVTYYRSTNGGTTWTMVTDLHSNQTIRRNGAPDLFVDDNGNVHVCYGSNSDQSANGDFSIRYVRVVGGMKVMDRMVTEEDELTPWKDGNGWGIGSVAASFDGYNVAVAYLTGGVAPGEEPADLYVRFSTNNGTNWMAPSLMATGIDAKDGRDTPICRAYGHHFYLAYPKNYEVYLRILRSVGAPPPTADAGGPYNSVEGDPIRLDMSASADDGYNAGLLYYSWDWDMDGVYDFVTDSAEVWYTFLDDFDADVVLRVTDRDLKYGYDTTRVTVVNAPPFVELPGDTTIDEGEMLQLTGIFGDPGDDTYSISWWLDDQMIGNQQTAEITFSEDGIYTIEARILDDDGGTDSDTLVVTALNVAPVVDAGGPYEATIYRMKTFTGRFFDPGIADTHTPTWDLDGDGLFEASGTQARTWYSEIGEFQIWFRVEDDDGGVGIDSTVVNVTNQAPVIGFIRDQTINEGGTFVPLDLRRHVDDPDHTFDQLVWNHYGNRELLVRVQVPFVWVDPPGIEWSGAETLVFKVTDPGGLQDSTDVIYTVLPVNDAPSWIDSRDYSFNEDDTLEIPYSSLWPMIIDVDDDSLDFRFWMMENKYLSSYVDTANKSIIVWSPPNWNGTTQVTFMVADRAGATDSDRSQITVLPIPDPPADFSLIDPLFGDYEDWPDTVLFRWFRPYDPDPGDLMIYEWNMRREGSSEAESLSDLILDTLYHFIPDTGMSKGTYLWWVTATDRADSTAESNIGIIQVGVVSGIDDETEPIPEAFQLLQNYPNPFNPETRITYHLPEESPVRLAIYNMLGREVCVLEEGEKSPGVHTLVWNARDRLGQKVQTGLYIYRLQAGSRVFYRKMMLIE